jgi:tRNA-guanine family transglycosylase
MTRKDLRWSVENVAELYRKIDADYLVSLDVPPNGQDRKSDRRRKYERTLENLEALLPEFGDRLVPVVHGRGHDELEQNCQRIHALTPSPKLIGIGGLVPMLQRCGNVRSLGADTPQAHVADAIHCVRRHFPRAKIHLFGVGSLHTVLGVIAAGADSVDSIGWRQAAGFGSVYIPGRHRRLLTHRERDTPCRPFVDRQELEILRSCPCPACRHAPQSNISALANHFKPRAAHNIWVLYSEIAAYLEARRESRGSAYLASRLSDAWLGALQ